MTKPNVYEIGLQKRYELWRKQHPKAIPWERLEQYLVEGDEFGDPVKIRNLASKADTTKTTMLKWLVAFDIEFPGRRKK